MSRFDFAKLKQELEDIEKRSDRDLSSDALFVAWYLLASTTHSELEALDALTGHSSEGGIDAAHIDRGMKVVTLVQGKYRRKPTRRAEKPESVDRFFRWGELLLGDKDAFDEELAGLEPLVVQRLEAARQFLQHSSDCRLNLHYVTLGSFSAAVRRRTENLASRLSRRHSRSLAYRLVDSVQAAALLHTWMIGAAPPIDTLELPIDQDTLQLTPLGTNVKSWVVSMSGADVANIFRMTNTRLFARNIRGYLGDTAINEAMEATIASEPEHFWFFNNGITLVCEKASEQHDGSSHLLVVTNPQVINGQQTTRVLADAGQDARRARVMVRVLAVPSESEEDTPKYEKFIASIVRATNHQNAVKLSDLHTNDAQQVALERGLRKLGYRYLRKRESRSERGARLGRGERAIALDEMARALGGCAKPGLPLRAGREKLFSDEHYETVFAGQSAKTAVCSYWLMRRVNDVAKQGHGDSVAWNRSKWIVLYFVWHELHDLLRRHQDAFIRACEAKGEGAGAEIKQALHGALMPVFKATVRHYRGARERDDEPNRFFKRREVYCGFSETWRSRTSRPDRRRFTESVNRLQSALEARTE